MLLAAALSISDYEKPFHVAIWKPSQKLEPTKYVFYKTLSHL